MIGSIPDVVAPGTTVVREPHIQVVFPNAAQCSKGKAIHRLGVIVSHGVLAMYLHEEHHFWPCMQPLDVLNVKRSSM